MRVGAWCDLRQTIASSFDPNKNACNAPYADRTNGNIKKLPSVHAPYAYRYNGHNKNPASVLSELILMFMQFMQFMQALLTELGDKSPKNGRCASGFAPLKGNGGPFSRPSRPVPEGTRDPFYQDIQGRGYGGFGGGRASRNYGIKAGNPQAKRVRRLLAEGMNNSPLVQKWVAQLQAQGGSIKVDSLPAKVSGMSSAGNITVDDNISSPEQALAVLAHELGNDRNNSITGTPLGPGESFAYLNKFSVADDIKDPVFRRKYMRALSGGDSRFPRMREIYQNWKRGALSTGEACKQMYKVSDTYIFPAGSKVVIP